MPKAILMTMAFFAIIACDCLTRTAPADEMPIVRHSRCGRDRPCVVYRRFSCPDRFSCYSLYGAYGPYGGPAYWSRYSYGGYGYGGYGYGGYGYGGWGYWR